MKAPSWKEKIKESCEAAGTYQPFFDSVIETLSSILERRDAARETFEESGGKVIIAYKNKGGATNPTKNPALVLEDELNKTALAYWRDLGLTPAGLKKINEDAMKPKKKSALAKALADLDKEL